jgi:hypothetical protein
MFEILKALMEMGRACEEAPDTIRDFNWHVDHQHGDGPTLVVRVALSDEDVELIAQMREMFAPV